jgi:LmbE family N-acetylglucosaminyl deacetylase
MKNILIVVSHPDDEVLGVGGTIKKFTRNGVLVNLLILATGISSRNGLSQDIVDKLITELRTNSIMASSILGIENVHFGDFPDNRMDGVDLLEIVKFIEKFIDKYKPDTIFTHFSGDLNIDHRVTSHAVMIATRPLKPNFVKKVIQFETLSSSEWTFGFDGSIFSPNYYENIKSTIEFKIKAMSQYSSELRPFPHPRSQEALKIKAQQSGLEVGLEYAERFLVIRDIENED